MTCFPGKCCWVTHSPPTPSPSPEVTGKHGHTWHLHVCWRSEPRPSSVYSKCSYPMSHLLSLTFFFCCCNNMGIETSPWKKKFPGTWCRLLNRDTMLHIRWLGPIWYNRTSSNQQEIPTALYSVSVNCLTFCLWGWLLSTRCKWNCVIFTLCNQLIFPTIASSRFDCPCCHTW